MVIYGPRDENIEGHQVGKTSGDLKITGTDDIPHCTGWSVIASSFFENQLLVSVGSILLVILIGLGGALYLYHQRRARKGGPLWRIQFSKRRILIVGGIVLLGILLAFLWWQQWQKGVPIVAPDSQPPDSSSPKQEAHEVHDDILGPPELLDIPDLYSELFWNAVPADELTLGETAFFYDNWSSEKDKSKQIRGKASLSGQEWRAELNGSDLEFVSTFEQYYASELLSRGWTESVMVEEFEINAAIADGPRGSIGGYLKIQGNKIRVILVEVSWESASKFPDFSCPCDMKFRVFISDIVSLDEILPL